MKEVRAEAKVVVVSFGAISATEGLENRTNPLRLRLPLGTANAFAEKGSGSERVMMDRGKERRSLGPSVGVCGWRGPSPDRTVGETGLEGSLAAYFEAL